MVHQRLKTKKCNIDKVIYLTRFSADTKYGKKCFLLVINEQGSSQTKDGKKCFLLVINEQGSSKTKN